MAVTQSILMNRQYFIKLDEEPPTKYAGGTHTPSANAIDFYPEDGFIREVQEVVKAPIADGNRHTSRREMTGKTVEWELTGRVHAEDIGWLKKWAFGSMIADFANGHYQYKLAGPGRDLPSFKIFLDTRKADHFATGEQTVCVTGCKVTELAIGAAQADNGQRKMVTITGEAHSLLSETQVLIEVLDYSHSSVSACTITIKINGTDQVLTEGTDFSAVTNNTTTGDNIKTAINTGVPITELSATDATGVVTVVPRKSHRIDSITTTADISAIRVTWSSTDVLMGLEPLVPNRSLLYNSASPTPYLFKGMIPQLDSAGYLASNKWQRYLLRVQNTFSSPVYGEETPGLYISEKLLRDQVATFAIDKEAGHAAAELDDYRNATERRIRVRHIHDLDRTAASAKYEMRYDLKRFVSDEFGDIARVGGGNDENLQNIVGECIRPEITTIDSNVVVGSSTRALALSVAFVSGSSGHGEAMRITGNGQPVTAIAVSLTSTNAPGSATHVYAMEIWTEDTGTNEPGSKVLGSESNGVGIQILNKSNKSILFVFPDAPVLTNGLDYFFVLHIKTAGAGGGQSVLYDAGAANTHWVTTNGGTTWAATNGTDEWNFEVFGSDVPLITDLYTQTAAASLFPDAS